jgi:aryl-alcohol dehydrogenase-like predicted oxidoreductase
VLRRAAELGVNHIDTADFYRATGARDEMWNRSSELTGLTGQEQIA